MPRISVIIPTYNRAHYICETINSVLEQTYKDYEIIVIDDGSTDNTKKVLKGYDGKIRYLYQNNKGTPAARNFGINNSTGEFIGLLDDDDLWLPNKLELQVKELEKNPELAFICSSTYIIDSCGKNIGQWGEKISIFGTFNDLYEENIVYNLTVLMRRKCFNDVGGYDEKLLSCQDYDLWLRMAKKYKFYYMAVPLTKHRKHDSNFGKNISLRLQNHLNIFNKIYISKSVSFLKRKIRIAKEFYKSGAAYYSNKNYFNASICYLKAIIVYPLIGYYFWPKEIRKVRFTFIYRIAIAYFLLVKCLFKCIKDM